MPVLSLKEKIKIVFIVAENYKTCAEVAGISKIDCDKTIQFTILRYLCST